MLCLCYPRPLSSTQLLLHSVGCCYDTTWKMTLEVNTQTQKSCYVFTHSVFFLLCMVDTIEKSCAHQSGVKPYWDCFAVSTLHNAAVVNINHTHTYKKKANTWPINETLEHSCFHRLLFLLGEFGSCFDHHEAQCTLPLVFSVVFPQLSCKSDISMQKWKQLHGF